jgi:hypothetical protein
MVVTAQPLPPLNSRLRAEDIDISNNLPRNYKVIGRHGQVEARSGRPFQRLQQSELAIA